MEEQIENNGNKMILNEGIKMHLYTTVRWAKFLSKVGFFVSGIIFLVAFFAARYAGKMVLSEMMPQGGKLPGGLGFLMTFFYLICALVYFVPCLYLYRFAKKTQSALDCHNETSLSDGVYYMARFFKYVGILTIIYLGILILSLLISLISNSGGVFS